MSAAVFIAALAGWALWWTAKKNALRDAVFVSQWKWLVEQAEQDMRQITYRLTPPAAHVSHYLTLEEGPRLEISISFFDCSSWPLRVDGLDGNVVYGGVFLKSPPQLSGNRDIAHGLNGLITIKQGIDSEQLALLKQKVVADQLILNLGNLWLTITANPDGLGTSAPTAFQLRLGNAYVQNVKGVFTP